MGRALGLATLLLLAPVAARADGAGTRPARCQIPDGLANVDLVDLSSWSLALGGGWSHLNGLDLGRASLLLRYEQTQGGRERRVFGDEDGDGFPGVSPRPEPAYPDRIEAPGQRTSTVPRRHENPCGLTLGTTHAFYWAAELGVTSLGGPTAGPLPGDASERFQLGVSAHVLAGWMPAALGPNARGYVAGVLGVSAFERILEDEIPWTFELGGEGGLLWGRLRARVRATLTGDTSGGRWGVTLVAMLGIALTNTESLNGVHEGAEASSTSR